MPLLTGKNAIKYYYKKIMLPKKIPNCIPEIKHFLDEDIKIRCLENINIRNNAEVFISALNLNNLQSDEILFQLKVYEEKLKSSMSFLSLSRYCMVGLMDYGYVYELEIYAKIICQTFNLLSKITHIIKNNKAMKLKDKNCDIHINTNMNKDLKSNINSYLVSKNHNNLKTEISKTEFTKTEFTKTEFTKTVANEGFNLNNISVENIIFYVYIIVFLIVILIFSSSYFGKKIIKLKNFAKEFNKKKLN